MRGWLLSDIPGGGGGVAKFYRAPKKFWLLRVVSLIPIESHE